MLSLFVLLIHCGLALCGVPNKAFYDYVIVGGGTSGLVIANRLSENPAITVAVIEAGLGLLQSQCHQYHYLWTVSWNFD